LLYLIDLTARIFVNTHMRATMIVSGAAKAPFSGEHYVGCDRYPFFLIPSIGSPYFHCSGSCDACAAAFGLRFQHHSHQ
jgi:hypothetical protein